MTFGEAIATVEQHGGTVRIGPKRVRPSDAVISGGWTDALISEIARRYNLRLSDLKGPRRHRRIAIPRRVAYWALRQLQLSYPEVGSALGGKDHSSVIHGYRLCTMSDRKAAVRAIRAVELRAGVRLLP